MLPEIVHMEEEESQPHSQEHQQKYISREKSMSQRVLMCHSKPLRLTGDGEKRCNGAPANHSQQSQKNQRAFSMQVTLHADGFHSPFKRHRLVG